MATGGLVWGTSLVLASVEAVRTRVPGDRWSGAQSTLADNVRLTGWWYLDEASEVLGGSPGRVRGWLRASVIVCVVALGSTPVVRALSSRQDSEPRWRTRCGLLFRDRSKLGFLRVSPQHFPTPPTGRG